MRNNWQVFQERKKAEQKSINIVLEKQDRNQVYAQTNFREIDMRVLSPRWDIYIIKAGINGVLLR